MVDTTRLLHPVVEAARELGIGRSLMYELIASKDVECVKIGRRTLVPHDELVRYVAGLTRARCEVKPGDEAARASKSRTQAL